MGFRTSETLPTTMLHCSTNGRIISIFKTVSIFFKIVGDTLMI